MSGAAPAGHLGRSLAWAISGNGLYFVLSFARNLLLARWLGPLAFGAWNLGLLLQQYGVWLNGGLLSGFRLAGPQARGAGDLSRLERLARAAWAACLLPSGIASLAALVVCLVHPAWSARAAAGFLAATLVPYQAYLFVNSVSAVEERFDRAARLQVVNALYGVVLFVPAVWLFGYWGAVGSLASSFLLAAGLLRTPLPRLSGVAGADLRELFRVGWPPALNGAIYAVFITIDRTVVASLLGVAALGQYSLTALARSTFGLVPTAVSEVVYVRASTLYGQTRDPSSLAGLVQRADLAMAGAAALAVALALPWVPLAVAGLLPAYTAGVRALEIFLVGLFFAFPVHGGVLLTSIGRAVELTVLYAAALAVELVLLALLTPRGIEGAALASAGATAALAVAVAVRGLGAGGVGTAGALRHLGTCVAPMAASLGALAGARLTLGPAGSVGAAAAQSALVLVAWGMVAAGAWRAGLLREERR